MAMPRIARSAGLLSMASRPSVVYRVSASHRLRLCCRARPSVVLLDRRRRSASAQLLNDASSGAARAWRSAWRISAGLPLISVSMR